MKVFIQRYIEGNQLIVPWVDVASGITEDEKYLILIEILFDIYSYVRDSGTGVVPGKHNNQIAIFS